MVSRVSTYADMPADSDLASRARAGSLAHVDAPPQHVQRVLGRCERRCEDSEENVVIMAMDAFDWINVAHHTTDDFTAETTTQIEAELGDLRYYLTVMA